MDRICKNGAIKRGPPIKRTLIIWAQKSAKTCKITLKLYAYNSGKNKWVLEMEVYTKNLYNFSGQKRTSQYMDDQINVSRNQTTRSLLGMNVEPING